MTERILVVENVAEERGPSTVTGTDLDSGLDVSLRYWPTHRGADGDYENPACKMEVGKCYRVGLRHSSRKGYDDEWMIREAEEIDPIVPPRRPTKDEYILAETCLKEAGESLRNDMTINGGIYSTKAHLEYTGELFRGTMEILTKMVKEKQ